MSNFRSYKSSDFSRSGRGLRLRARRVKVTPYCDTEDGIQEQFVAWFRTKWPETILYSVPNGSYKTPAQRYLFQKTGQLAGICDLVIAEAMGGYFGAYLELKSESGSVAPNQKIVIPKLMKAGYKVGVKWSLEDAKKFALMYLEQPPTPLAFPCTDSDIEKVLTDAE